jgi:pSer/pThr/pTyr-binding forkhead associated (FHA) protein
MSFLSSTVISGDDCDVQMKIQCISRLHVELIVDENSDATLINRSINGTVLNGKILNKNGQSSLKHNDRFTVGNREFRFSKGATVQPKSACFAPAGPDEVTAELSSVLSPFRKARQSIGVALAVSFLN